MNISRQITVSASLTNALHQLVTGSAKVNISINGAAGVGDLSLSKAYPVPFKSNSGDPYIHFKNLPEGTHIRIFTMNGRLVQSLDAPASGLIDWDVRNADSNKLASGVYLYIMKSGDQKKEGKLVIIQ